MSTLGKHWKWGKPSPLKNRILRICKQCGKQFETIPHHVKSGKKGNFCSRACVYLFRSKKKKVKCLQCGKIFLAKNVVILHGGGKFCSNSCKTTFWYRSHRPHNWKGGRHPDSSGYILTLKPDHHLADVNGYVLEHRLVMEQKIGRYLQPEEIVHHINQIRIDNHPENLLLFPNNKEHKKFHQKSLITHG